MLKHLIITVLYYCRINKNSTMQSHLDPWNFIFNLRHGFTAWIAEVFAWFCTLPTFMPWLCCVKKTGVSNMEIWKWVINHLEEKKSSISHFSCKIYSMEIYSNIQYEKTVFKFISSKMKPRYASFCSDCTRRMMN